jgi:hypothetical protein
MTPLKVSASFGAKKSCGLNQRLRDEVGDEALDEAEGIVDVGSEDELDVAVSGIVAEVADGLNASPGGLGVEDVAKGVVVATELRPRCEAASGTEVSEVVFEDATDEHHGRDVVAGSEKLDGLLKHVVMDGTANARSEGLELA